MKNSTIFIMLAALVMVTSMAFATPGSEMGSARMGGHDHKHKQEGLAARGPRNGHHGRERGRGRSQWHHGKGRDQGRKGRDLEHGGRKGERHGQGRKGGEERKRRDAGERHEERRNRR